MNPSGWLPGITDAALAHPKEYARGSIGTTERVGYPSLGYTLAISFSTASAHIYTEALVRRRLAVDGAVLWRFNCNCIVQMKGRQSVVGGCPERRLYGALGRERVLCQRIEDAAYGPRSR